MPTTSQANCQTSSLIHSICVYVYITEIIRLIGILLLSTRGTNRQTDSHITVIYYFFFMTEQFMPT